MPCPYSDLLNFRAQSKKLTALEANLLKLPSVHSQGYRAHKREDFLLSKLAKGRMHTPCPLNLTAMGAHQPEQH